MYFYPIAAVSRGLGRGLAVGVNVKVDRGDGVGLAVGVRLLVEARRPNVLRAGESGSLQASMLERLQVGWSVEGRSGFKWEVFNVDPLFTTPPTLVRQFTDRMLPLHYSQYKTSFPPPN